MTRRRDKGNKFRHPNLKALVNNREHRQRNRVGGRRHVVDPCLLNAAAEGRGVKYVVLVPPGNGARNS